jgi:hypothetical protein
MEDLKEYIFAKPNKQIELRCGDHNKGVSITLNKSKKQLEITCWYDSGYGGMNTVIVPIAEFKREFGI